MDDATTVFVTAARFFAALVQELADFDWTGPGLGDWDLRALIGHTSRSLTTVSTYLQTTAELEDITSPQAYYAAIRTVAADIGPGDIVERGRKAGRDLGDDPATAVNTLLTQAIADIAAVDDPLISVIGGLGIRLHNYLPTRTFELAVHSADIGRAAGVAVELPAEVLESATVLAAQVAVLVGDGPTVLDTLTGRGALPSGFSVV